MKSLVLAVLLLGFNATNAWSYDVCGNGDGGPGPNGSPCRIHDSEIISCVPGSVFVCERDKCPATVEPSVGMTYEKDGRPLGAKRVELGVDVCLGTTPGKVTIKARR